eukprot:scaffold94723_cov60-Phaeocystis_antarctica.AAC.3
MPSPRSAACGRSSSTTGARTRASTRSSEATGASTFSPGKQRRTPRAVCHTGLEPRLADPRQNPRRAEDQADL